MENGQIVGSKDRHARTHAGVWALEDFTERRRKAKADSGSVRSIGQEGSCSKWNKCNGTGMESVVKIP
jgi:hypothetical protein